MAYEALKLENQLCFPLYAASREIIKKYKPFLDEIGLTYNQYIVLMVLWEEKETTAKHIGQRLYLDSGTLTPLLKKLEKDGLIRRNRLQEDERNLAVSLTEKGESLKKRAGEIPAKVGACINLLPKEAAALYQLLYKILKK